MAEKKDAKKQALDCDTHVLHSFNLGSPSWVTLLQKSNLCLSDSDPRDASESEGERHRGQGGEAVEGREQDQQGAAHYVCWLCCLWE